MDISFPSLFCLAQCTGHLAATFLDFADGGWLVLCQGVLDEDGILEALVLLIGIGLFIL